MEIAIAFLLLLLLGSKKKTGKPVHNNDQTPPGNSNGSTQLFKSQFYDWLSSHEGGLNNKYAGGDLPSDTSCTVPGMSPNPHTSAGVKKSTYDALTPVLHLPGTCADFIAMSSTPKSNSWYKIVDHYIDLGLAYSPNLVLGAYIGTWKWGGWNQTYVSPEQVLAIIQNDNLTLSNKLRQLVDLRKSYFQQLQQKHGYGQDLVDVWKERADDYYNKFNSFLT